MNLQPIILNQTLNTGQVCLAPERIYVERAVFDGFVAGLKSRAEALRPGLPQDEGMDFGPLISEEHRRKVLGYYDLAVAEGATVVTGGSVPEISGEAAHGYFVQPTVWTGLPHTARVCREEIFGPCCAVIPFDSEGFTVPRH